MNKRVLFSRLIKVFLVIAIICAIVSNIVIDSDAKVSYANEEETGISSLYGQLDFDYDKVPEYKGKSYVCYNDNQPFFAEEDMRNKSFEYYAPLDNLKRCTEAYACIGKEMLPKEPRESVYAVFPTGYHSIKYDIVEGKYLYNRCHLIGYQLTGQNANKKNLITGTRYLNVNGMLQFEDMVASYIKETGNHVLYRVTPYFHGDDLVARGVIMEAKSVEDGGKGITYCVFIYNVQPGIEIDYSNGNSQLALDKITN